MKTIARIFMIILIVGASTGSAKEKSGKFYLTQDVFTGGQALTACADGYHMASLWEFFLTSLTYNTKLGFVEDDSGFGPPARFGWIRTGRSSSGNIGAVGGNNCFAWTSSDSSHFGTIVMPTQFWGLPPEGSSPWRAGNHPCNISIHVWCVKD